MGMPRAPIRFNLLAALGTPCSVKIKAGGPSIGEANLSLSCLLPSFGTNYLYKEPPQPLRSPSQPRQIKLLAAKA